MSIVNVMRWFGTLCLCRNDNNMGLIERLVVFTASPSRCTLAKATDQHHERARAYSEPQGATPSRRTSP